MLADIAVRPDRDIDFLAVGRCRQIACPVVIGRLCVEPRQHLTLARNLRVACLIGKDHQRIGIGDEQPVADQNHTERRVQPGDKRRFQFRFAVAIRIAQQRDAVRRWHTSACLAH